MVLRLSLSSVPPGLVGLGGILWYDTHMYSSWDLGERFCFSCISSEGVFATCLFVSPILCSWRLRVHGGTRHPCHRVSWFLLRYSCEYLEPLSCQTLHNWLTKQRIQLVNQCPVILPPLTTIKVLPPEGGVGGPLWTLHPCDIH